MRKLITACAIGLALLSAPTTMLAQDTYTKTKYPIVLVHGLLGFDAVGPVQYFYGIPSELRRSGATVYTASVSQSNSTEVRGEQLLRELQALKAKYGHEKFNLVGHSHGGNTSRYVAGVAPGLVASVTTVGTPHRGSKVADALQGITNFTGTTGLVAGVVNGLSSVVAYLSGSPSNPQNALQSLQSLSTAGSLTFNNRFKDGAPTSSCGQGANLVNNVRYYSMGGTSVYTNVLDISDGFLGAAALFYGFEQNDGVVGRCSNHWGTVLRDNYGWNHIDQINHVFGLRNVFVSDPVAVYRAQANRLKGVGL
ncbi:MAG: triacylglycerol lipase [Hydrogenophaga sp.]|uniref:triacylglycerol lipase n=1 Tax=Hydrogenophaga sp. TaxID=1904254 RepID=UPI00274CB091|nr:triacylglycerol lipase [Hydrogenophaga sp.]MDP2419196.1 triacylglycerol lipase [Hydrogenophaga sp.]MDZ4187017.1 triacylglycerol lipase [Hydrogenophaga sp.]